MNSLSLSLLLRRKRFFQSTKESLTLLAVGREKNKRNTERLSVAIKRILAHWKTAVWFGSPAATWPPAALLVPKLIAFESSPKKEFRAE